MERGRSMFDIDTDINTDTMTKSERISSLIRHMRENPKGVTFSELCRVCDFHFGSPRQVRSSHRIYRTPWKGDPRINIQNSKGMAKAYQVRQVLKALERLEQTHGE
jgi:hypothetical protein